MKVYSSTRYTKSIIRLSRTNRTIPIPRILNHLPRTRIQLQLPHKIQNQIEQESQQLIKNLILSNQINNVTPTQIKIQF